MTKKKTARRCILGVLLILLVALAVWIAWGNTALEVNTYTIESDTLPAPFDGFRIAQISDLHNATFGEENARLLAMLAAAEPDIIVITGDLIDSRNTDTATALSFVEGAMAIAPCYYVTGNHEARTVEYATMKAKLLTLGVTVLEDLSVPLVRERETIRIVGVNDPDAIEQAADDEAGDMVRRLGALMHEGDGFTVLLSHRPELFDAYVASGVDLVFCGHAHGGQIRLPFLGGLVAPDQGLFPTYDSGLYTEEDTHMLVSRGLGNSLFPFRVNNRPEIIVAELSVTAD